MPRRSLLDRLECTDMDTELHLGYGVMGSSAEILAEGGQAPPLQPKTPPSPGVGSLQSMSSTVTATDLLPYQPYSPPKETWYWLSLQVTVPFLIAGVGTIGAGLLLGTVEDWEVFKHIKALFILVPSLVGLKGNLDTCLASRLCTQANLGNLKTWKNCWKLFVSNIALVQVQSIVASLTAAAFAITVSVFMDGLPDYRHALLMAASAVTTATTACFVLDSLMMALIVASHRLNINPDNVVCLMAGSFGDIVSLSVLSTLSNAFFLIHETMWWVFILIIVGFLLMLPFWVWLALRHKHTAVVLRQGWTPVLSALFISGLGGIVLDKVVGDFKGFVLFNPIVNGIGGNLASVQASRTATMLHSTSVMGVLSDHSPMCVSPIKALFYGVPSAKSARVLIAVALPGQALFAVIADYIHNGMHSTITFEFMVAYLVVVLLQVMIILYLTHLLAHFMWRRKLDPDNSTIPYLTACADLLGTILLACAFMLLKLNGTPYGED
ncbi:solute carrier family 41 member 1-like isoform X3 [Thrips palmi]|uniref:Solute carrier family 41 member 1-like isoform X3 n=1 Tax=Thrips palmi TaxID=161013 RepID=A0A6P8ZGZ5_THRPL|nr:solute carrier family 41 member 1-like isoform X3 [Thrips palmi]